MKCIGNKSEMVWIGLVIGIIALAASITGLITVDKSFRAIMVLLIVITVGINIWQFYICFFIPFEVLLYDKENKILKIRYNFKKIKEINSDDIKKIIVTKNLRALWSSVCIVLNNNEEIYVNRLDVDEDINEYFTIEKNRTLG